MSMTCDLPGQANQYDDKPFIVKYFMRLFTDDVGRCRAVVPVRCFDDTEGGIGDGQISETCRTRSPGIRTTAHQSPSCTPTENRHLIEQHKFKLQSYHLIIIIDLL